MSAAAYLEGLTSHSVAEAAGAVRELLLSTATPESDAEALAHAAASMPRATRAAVLGGIAWALSLRALDLGSCAAALAGDGAVLGEIRLAGIDDPSLHALMMRTDVRTRAAYLEALRKSDAALGAARIRERAAEAIAAADAQAAERIAANERAAAAARDEIEAALAAARARHAAATAASDATSIAAEALASTRIEWSHTDDVDHPYRGELHGHALLIRLNDFPAEPAYTLFVDGVAVQDLEDWPATWARPASPAWMLELVRREQ